MRRCAEPKHLSCCCVAVALLSGPPRPASADLGELWKLTTQAVGYIVKGQPVAAILALKQARTHQAMAEIDGLIGVAALVGGHPDQAQRQLARAAARGAQPVLYYWAARAAFQAGQPAEARRHLDRALAAGGDQPRLRMGHALVAKALGRRAEALDSLLEVARRWSNLADPRLYPLPAEGAVELMASALSKFPRRQALMRTQGYLYWRLGRILQAQERFARIVQQRAGDADALQMLAQCSYRLGHADEALRLARQAMKAAPDLPLVRATYGELLLATGEPQAAVPQLKRAADARPRDAPLLALLARACFEVHDLDCAAKFYRYASRRDPQLLAAHLGLATALEQKGENGLAAEALERALALGPVQPRVYEVAAHLARVRNDERAAKELLAQARRRRSGQRRMQRVSRAAQKLVRDVERALQDCACRPRCSRKDSVCKRSTARLKKPLRDFMLAHHDLQRGRRARARARLRRVLRELQPKRLLLGDPSQVAHTFVLGGKKVAVPELVPMVAFGVP